MNNTEQDSRARVDFADGRQITPKNLGWLLHHAAECEIIVLRPRPEGAARLDAYGQDWHYVTPFASYSVAAEWVRRRRFEHVDISMPAQ